MPRAILYLLIPLLLAGALVGGYFAFRTSRPVPNPNPVEEEDDTDPPPPADGGPPKLVVLVVFDQMRGDYLSRWAELYGPDGFNRFKKEGIWFSDCQIPYACTITGPGHASLATGAPPSVHGIVGNQWYDRKSRETMYCCEPTRFYELIPPVPEKLGKLSRGDAKGFSPERLLAQTVADSLVESTKGKGRVFSFSIKDRTAVLMGGQKPSGVYCFDTRDGKFHTGAYYGRDAAHPWVTELNNSKLPDSWFEQKWEKLRPDIDYAKYSGPDDVDAESPGVNGQGRAFPHPYKGKLAAPAAAYYSAVEASPAGNELLFALAKKCVRGEKLGRGESPDLLCISFSSNDILGHIYGPDSQEVMDMTLRSDQMIGQFLQFLDARVGKGRYVMVISSDHGVLPLPDLESTKAKYPAAKRVALKDLTAGLGEALDAAFGKEGGVPTKWLEIPAPDNWPWVYLNRAAIEARKLKVDDVAVFVRDWLAGRGPIETAFTRKELEGTAAADKPFLAAAKLAYHPGRCGDVFAIPKAGVLATSYKSGTSHGTPHPYDTHIPFLIYGGGVPALGQRAEKVSSLSVAPTLAWALGVPAPKDAAVLPPAAIPVKK
jgi:hypothetical protein